MNKFGKYNPRILYRCMSCGATIRKGDKYHELHIKGQAYIFCKLCVELSDHIAVEKGVNKVYVIACIYRTDEGECILENKPCDGCQDAPHFIDWEGDQDDE